MWNWKVLSKQPKRLGQLWIHPALYPGTNILNYSLMTENYSLSLQCRRWNIKMQTPGCILLGAVIVSWQTETSISLRMILIIQFVSFRCSRNTYSRGTTFNNIRVVYDSPGGYAHTNRIRNGKATMYFVLKGITLGGKGHRGSPPGIKFRRFNLANMSS